MKLDRKKVMLKAFNDLQGFPEDVPEHMKQPISFLRQWLNEDRKCTPMVTNTEIWSWLKIDCSTYKWNERVEALAKKVGEDIREQEAKGIKFEE